MKKKFLKVKELAIERGIETAIELMYETRLSQGTAYSLWHDRISRVDQSTLIKLSKTLNVPIGQLFADDYNNESDNGDKGQKVGIEENKAPVCVSSFTIQHTRGTVQCSNTERTWASPQRRAA
jgi:DNA-binding Xre family transcriptional regulator